MTMIIKKGVIIFLDALGVSQFETTEQYIDFIFKIKKLKVKTDHVWKGWQGQFDKDSVILPEPDIVTFQDTIIVCFPEPEDKEKTLHYFFAAGQWLTQAITLAIGERIFFRGSISVGEYIMDISQGNVTVMGLPISEAHNFEKTADWIGVIQTPTFQQKYIDGLRVLAKEQKQSIERMIEEYRFLFIPYQVPLKGGGTDEFFVVSWPQVIYHHKKEFEEITTILSETARNVDPRYKPKYENTLVFLRGFKGK